MKNKKFELRTYNEGETRKLGEIIGRNLDPGDIVALIGDLGAGKTCMTKGLAKSLGVSDQYEITSPTFTIINEYPGIMTFWHVDVYRLESSRDMIDAGFEDLFSSSGVVVIEWAEKILDILPPNTLFITFEYVDDTTRVVRISGRGSIINQIMEGYKH
jgi:tRNA threonylcarbamoyladenosine biosynthesis protein TsaE